MTKERESRRPSHPIPGESETPGGVKPLTADEEEAIWRKMETMPATRVQAEIEVLGENRANELRQAAESENDLVIAPRPRIERKPPITNEELGELIKDVNSKPTDDTKPTDQAA